MSTRAEHYAEAERLLAVAEETDWHIDDPQSAQFVAFALAAAQVHAVLASVPVPEVPPAAAWML